MDKAFIEVQDLDAWVSDRHVLNRVTFAVDRQNILTIIGPRGSGKSNLLRCMNRLFEEKPEHYVLGNIFLEGDNVLSPDYDLLSLRRRLAMLFARPTCFPHLSVFENVALGLRLAGEESGAEIGIGVERALNQVYLWEKLKDHLHKFSDKLSVGQQQLVCLARCLTLNPMAILMDEPTSAIGLQMSMQFEQIIRELSQQMTLIMTTSSRKQAARISDRTAFLLDGELVEIGKTSDLFMNPRDTRTEDFLTGRFG